MLGDRSVKYVNYPEATSAGDTVGDGGRDLERVATYVGALAISRLLIKGNSILERMGSVNIC